MKMSGQSNPAGVQRPGSRIVLGEVSSRGLERLRPSISLVLRQELHWNRSEQDLGRKGQRACSAVKDFGENSTTNTKFSSECGSIDGGGACSSLQSSRRQEAVGFIKQIVTGMYMNSQTPTHWGHVLRRYGRFLARSRTAAGAISL
jgi:hypothetical protein